MGSSAAPLKPSPGRRRGRPRNSQKKITVTLTLPEATLHKLKKIAYQSNRNKGEVVSTLIDEVSVDQ
jgi:hypothetical protein